MSDVLAKNLIEERVDIAFRNTSDGDLRSLTPRTLRSLFDEPPGKKILTFDAENFSVHNLGETTLIVFDRRIVIKSSRCALDGALSLLWRLKDSKLERVIYQRQGYQASQATNFGGLREGLARLRSEAGERLGPAVVVGETALFHPPPHCKRIANSQSSLRVLMGRMASRVENALRMTNSFQRQAALNNLELNSAIGVDSVLQSHGFSNSNLTWTLGENIATLSLVKKGSSVFALFEYDGVLRTSLNPMMTKLQAALGPRDLQVEAIHSGGVTALPNFAGSHWELQPLGASESISTLTLGGDSSLNLRQVLTSL